MQGTVGGWLTVGAVPLVGMLYFWWRKWQTRLRSGPDTFATYFLGGAKVGPTLTGNNNWGICFAFGNAIWYYAYLGYYYGPAIFLLQVPWSLSIVGLSLLLHRYIAASSDGTVHGFIGAIYGPRAAVLAAIATITGYTLNCGFEIFYSTHLLAISLNITSAELVLAAILAIFIGSYCLAGGYLGSVVTDPIQNRLGLAATVVLIVGLWPTLLADKGNMNIFHAHASFQTPTIPFLVGVVVFTFFFNFVDMANWQSLAANRDLPKTDLGRVRVDLIRSAAIQMIAPGLVGVWLGVVLKQIPPALADDAYFHSAFRTSFAHIDVYSGLCFGLVLLGFLGVTISSAGSYVLAAMQTLAADLFKRRQMAEYRKADTEEKLKIEEHVIEWVKRYVIVVALAMTLCFGALYYLLDAAGFQGGAFSFQFAMYGAAVTLFPAVIWGLWRKPLEGAPNQAGFWSILFGLIFVLCPFVAAMFFWNSPPFAWVKEFLPSGFDAQSVINLTPAFGLGAATITLAIVARFRRKA